MTLFDHLQHHVSCLQFSTGKKWQEYKNKHIASIKKLVKLLPPASPTHDVGGPSHGTSLDFYLSSEDELVFRTNRRHLQDGIHLGWSGHTIRATSPFGIKVESDYSDATDVENIDAGITLEFHKALKAQVADAQSQKALPQPRRIPSLNFTTGKRSPSAV